MPTAARKPKATPPPPPPSAEEREPEQGPDIPATDRRERTAKFRRIQQAVEGIYIMLGGGLTTLPMVSPRTKHMGISLARSAEEIADAWTDLAEEDRKVLAVLEQFISFSGWGKVIGVHFIAIGAGIPGIGMRQGQPQQQSQQQQPAGASDMEQAFQLADMLRTMQSEARVQTPGNGSPPQQPTEDQLREAAQRQQEQQARGQVRRAQPTGFRGRAGMPSPADLGVQVPDVPESFPASGSESVKGG